MSYKDKLIKIREMIEKLDSDSKIEYKVNRDLGSYSKEDLMKIYSKDSKGFNILTKVFELVTLSDELLYLGYEYNNFINSNMSDSKITILVILLALISLSGKMFAEKEHDDAEYKIQLLSLKKEEV